jgi:hypothetical protein
MGCQGCRNVFRGFELVFQGRNRVLYGMRDGVEVSFSIDGEGGEFITSVTAEVSSVDGVQSVQVSGIANIESTLLKTQ